MHMHLYKMGYITIPLVGKNPAPGVKGWGLWATDGIPEEEVERFERDYPLTRYGIGLVGGPASNNTIIGDCDSVDEALQEMLPPSPLSRFGQRGFARIYSNPLGIQSCKFERKNQNLHRDPTGKEIEGIEIRGRGLYIAIPPTIHPVTHTPYTWLGDGRIETLDPEHIPPLLAEHLNPMSAITGAGARTELGGTHVHSNSSRCPHGSHNRLKALAAGFVSAQMPIERAVEDLLRYDETHHKPLGYFFDKSRSECQADPRSNALKFYSNIMNSINRDRIKRGEPPQGPQNIPIISLNELRVKPEACPVAAFPPLPGLLGIFKDGILHKTRRNQEALAVGGALALGSVLCAHRFKINGSLAHTKLYIMNIGETGVGKDAPFKYIKAVLSHPDMRDDRLLGFENYSSKAAILETLTKQKVRLDLRDEFKDTFIAIANNKGATGNEISSFMNQHFTDSGWYGGHYTKTDKFVGACYDPSISILAGIQPGELINTATSSNIADGFLGRFIYFVADTYAEYVGRQGNSLAGRVNLAVSEIKRVLPKLQYDPLDITGGAIDPEHWVPKTEDMQYHPAYAKYIDDKDRSLADEEDRLGRNDMGQERAILTRLNMFTERLAIIIAACSGDRTITIEHAQLAEKVLLISREKSLAIIGQSGNGTINQDSKKILDHISTNGHITISAVYKIIPRNRREKSYVKRLMETMVDSLQVREIHIPSGNPKNGNPVLGYRLNDSTSVN